MISRTLLKVLCVFVLTILLQCQPSKTTTKVAAIVADSVAWKKLQGSGSLVYKGSCEAKGIAPRYPLHDALVTSASSPLQDLRNIFAGDPKMNVALESNGMIRMSESDVSRQLLDVKIRRINFDMGDILPHGRLFWSQYSGNRILWPILEATEVQAFMQAHNVHPLGWKDNLFWQISGPSYSSGIHVRGQIENVTVAQALDHVAKTFPGLWVYSECVADTKNRLVSFDFLDNRVDGQWQQIEDR